MLAKGSFLVGVQAGASMVLLVLAALLGRALLHVSTADLGFPADRLLNVTLGMSRKLDPSLQATIRAAALEQLRELLFPGAGRLFDPLSRVHGMSR